MYDGSHLHIINIIKFILIWHAVRGEGSELGILAQTQSSPQFRKGIVVSAEKGWRRDAGKLPMNRGKSAVYIQWGKKVFSQPPIVQVPYQSVTFDVTSE